MRFIHDVADVSDILNRLVDNALVIAMCMIGSRSVLGI